MKDSKFLSIGTKDIVKGILMAVLVPVVTIIQQSLENGVLVFEWKSIIIASLSGGLAYLVKNFFTAPKVQEEK
jgi:hypothetical protein